MWRRGADGKMEHVSLGVICQEYKKVNHDMFALTFGQQDIPPMAQKMSKKRQRLNYKHYHCSIKRSGYMAFPDGLIKKFKARFCARGDQQIKGIDFFETYAPVVQWTTIFKTDVHPGDSVGIEVEAR